MLRGKLVFLDSSTADRGDLDLSVLKKFGECAIHEYSTAGEIPDRLAGCTIALTNKAVIGRTEMEASPELKLIVVCATGVNNVDLDAARDCGIVVCNVSGYSTDSVAQHVIMLTLNLLTNAIRLNNERQAWAQSRIFTRLDYPVGELAGRTMGIAGLGAIGTRVGEIAEFFGMQVQCLARDGSTNKSRPEWLRLPRRFFFESSDVVTLHCPLTDSNRHMINAESLGWMKPTAFLINTGRGPLVDEEALLESLRGQRLAGAGLDVLSAEPPPADHPLLTADLPNLIITPHTAWSSLEARQRLLKGAVKNIDAFLSGYPINRVN